MKQLLCLSFVLMLPLSGNAQAATPGPDFSEGFKKLAALGLPALDSQATWAKLPETANYDYQLRELTKGIKGNGWSLTSANEKTTFLPLGGLESINGKSSPKPPTTSPDLTKDVTIIISTLKKLAAKKDPDDMYSFNSRAPSFGSLFLFAAQLHQTGHTDLANQLALAVFEVYPSREAAVDSAINQLADRFYQQATRAFFTSGDWAAYHQTLAALRSRFPRGWSSYDAVALFLPQLEKQATGTVAPTPSLPDIPIDPRALEIIRELNSKPTPKTPPAPNALPPEIRRHMSMRMMEGYDSDQYRPSSLWLLDDQTDSTQKTSPLARLAALKMSALPALAALVSDTFLTHLPNPQSSSGSYFSPNEDRDERTLRTYASLNRPATRGELASQLLAATLPDPQNELREADPETLRDLALDFWKTHNSATREELAAVFLREGDSSQASQAASILASSSDPKAHQIFESHILATDPAINSFQDVQTYLRTRKAAARPFFDAYAKLVRTQSQNNADDSENYDSRSYMIKQAGGTAKILKQLEGLVGRQSPRSFAVQIAKGKPHDAITAIKSLDGLLTGSSPTKHLFTLLEGANAATDPSIRARFLIASFSIQWLKEEEQEKEDSPTIDRKISDPEIKVWQKLIADTRPLPKELNRYAENTQTVAEIATNAFEFSISPHSQYLAREASIILAKPASAILAERAAARLSGKPVPPFPDASKISKERLAEIVATAGKKSAPEVHPYLSTLTPDERATWLEWFNKPDDIPYPASVQELQSVVTAKSSATLPENTNTTTAGIINPGFKVTPDSLAKLIESLAPEIEKHSRSTIQIRPADFGPGLEFLVESIPLPTKNNNPSESEPDLDGERLPQFLDSAFSNCIVALESNETANAVALLSLRTQESCSQSVWLIQNAKASLQPPAKQDDDDKESNPFDSLKTQLESKEPQRIHIQIQFLTRADAEKFKTTSKEQESEEE